MKLESKLPKTIDKDTRLNCDAIDAKPQDYSWDSETHSEYTSEGKWNTVAPDFSSLDASELASYLDDQGQDYDPRAEDEDEDDFEERLAEQATEHAQEDGSEHVWPMMSYAYPIRGLTDLASAQAMLQVYGSCVCIVEIEDEPFLALTGGGMDLSWEICETYILLGYWPPVHFSDLPRMGGRGQSAGDRIIIRACLESCRIRKNWTSRVEENLERMLAE